MALLNQWRSDGLLTQSVYDRLNLFVDLLEEWNPKINLTGLRSRAEIEEVLVGESILAARAYPLSGKSVLDVGSGSGVPGLIWKLYDPTIQLTSVEARAKKVAFQKEAIRTLGLEAIIIRGLFPDVVRAESFDVITTRAVRLSRGLLKQATPLLRPTGTILGFLSANITIDDLVSTVVPLSGRSSLLIYQP